MFSITSSIGVIACLRYDLAIMLPERQEDAANLLTVSLFLALVVAMFSGVLVVLREPITRLLKVPALSAYLWLVPVAVLANGGFLALNYWNSRSRRFGRLSATRVVKSTATTGYQLAAGFAGTAHAGGLIGGWILGLVTSTVLLGGQTWHTDHLTLGRSVTWPRMIAGLKRYRKFPLYSTWSALLNSISWQLPTFLLSAFFSPAVVGYYAVGTRLLRLPMSLIGAAIGQVFFQRAAQAKANGTLTTLVENAFRRLVMLAMFPLLVITIIGQDLFSVVLGGNWAEAGVYAQILSIWTFFWFMSSPLSTLYSVLEMQEAGLVLNVIILVTRFLSLWIGGIYGSARLALILFGASGVLVYGYIGLAIMKAAGVPWRTLFGILMHYFALFIPAAIILIPLKAVGIHSVALVAVSCLVLGVYFLYVVSKDPIMRNFIKRIGIRE